MYVWSKRLVIGLLAAFVLVLVVFLTQGQLDEESALNMHTDTLDHPELCRPGAVGLRVDDRPDADAGKERVGVALTVPSCPLAYADGSHPVSSAPNESVMGSVLPHLDLDRSLLVCDYPFACYAAKPTCLSMGATSGER